MFSLDADGKMVGWSSRQTLFYVKSARFWAGAIGVTAWAFIAVALGEFWPTYSDGYPYGGLAVLLAVAALTKAPTKQPEWDRLA